MCWREIRTWRGAAPLVSPAPRRQRSMFGGRDRWGRGRGRAAAGGEGRDRGWAQLGDRPRGSWGWSSFGFLLVGGRFFSRCGTPPQPGAGCGFCLLLLPLGSLGAQLLPPLPCPCQQAVMVAPGLVFTQVKLLPGSLCSPPCLGKWLDAKQTPFSSPCSCTSGVLLQH